MPTKTIIKLTVLGFLILNGTAYAMLAGLSFNLQNPNDLLPAKQTPYDKQNLKPGLEKSDLHKKSVSHNTQSRFGDDLEVFLAGYRAISRSS